MTKFKEKNDSTVQPASRMMSSNAVFAEIFSFLADCDRSIQALISGLGEIRNAHQTLINSLHSFEEHWDLTEERLNYLEDKDDQSDRLKDEILGLKQMVASNSSECRSVQDVWSERYSTEQDEQ